MLAPDQVTRDRRPLVGIDTDGADGVAEAYPRDQETRGLSSTVETVAVRGDRLALVRWRAISGSGREWDDFHLVRWTADDLNELNVIFPPDRLGDAIDELDRLYLETVSPSSPEAGNVRLSGAVYRSLREGHLDEAMALLDERYVQRDHRSIGWPTVDWAGMRERLSTMVGADAVPWCARIHRTDGLAGLWQAAVRVTGEHGAEQTDHHLLVTVDNPATGLVESIDQFPLEQLDEATRVFRERAAAARTSGPRWNEASVVAAFIASAARIGRPELAADLVAGDAGPPLAGGRRHVIAAPNAPVALVALLDEEAVPAGYVVERLDAAGRMESVESFAADDLRAAADAFDARFLESVGEPDGIPQLLANYVTAWRDRDIERMRTMLTDDFEGIDRRPIAVPPLDREGHLAAVEAMAASGEVAVLVSGPFAANEQGSVTGIALVGRDDAGRLTESLQSISMLIVSDGLLSFGEIYPVDAVGAAVARFHELTRPADQPEHEPWNEADRLSRIGLRAFFDAADDDDRHRNLHPDHVSDDRRPPGRNDRGPRRPPRRLPPQPRQPESRVRLPAPRTVDRRRAARSADPVRPRPAGRGDRRAEPPLRRRAG
jgi:hypothetical protein